MTQSIIPFHYITGANVTQDCPNGDLDRIMRGVNLEFVQGGPVLGEPVAHLLECMEAAKCNQYQQGDSRPTFDRRISAEQIRRICSFYNDYIVGRNTSGQFDPECVAWWRFSEGENYIKYDVSNFSNQAISEIISDSSASRWTVPSYNSGDPLRCDNLATIMSAISTEIFVRLIWTVPFVSQPIWPGSGNSANMNLSVLWNDHYSGDPHGFDGMGYYSVGTCRSRISSSTQGWSNDGISLSTAGTSPTITIDLNAHGLDPYYVEWIRPVYHVYYKDSTRYYWYGGENPSRNEWLNNVGAYSVVCPATHYQLSANNTLTLNVSTDIAPLRLSSHYGYTFGRPSKPIPSGYTAGEYESINWTQLNAIYLVAKLKLPTTYISEN